MAESAGLSGLRRAEAADIPALVALQQAAYARNRPLLGVEPVPLLADYADILATQEIWLAENRGALEGALILDLREGAFLIWSVAVAPAARVGSAIACWPLPTSAHANWGTGRCGSIPASR
jgi:hypothetical protein